MFINSSQENISIDPARNDGSWRLLALRRNSVLMDGDDPVGGKWSFDEDNRKKVPGRWEIRTC